MPRLFASLLLLAAALAAETNSVPQEFLAVAADKGNDKPHEAWESPPEPPVAVASEKVKEIELAENPYVATSTTAEGLALIFMMVSCVICYLECCK
ncbi:unnamed protein product [Symbiodinium natans]|uniref:Uncharacterized protein n=1 Tax=Symbiodinium natans TaxID=878477 RepID=A0A812PKA2_9DINO|nr:unnamed protein product [Symbiodinium natans]